jgi:hypothetical protein
MTFVPTSKGPVAVPVDPLAPPLVPPARPLGPLSAPPYELALPALGPAALLEQAELNSVASNNGATQKAPSARTGKLAHLRWGGVAFKKNSLAKCSAVWALQVSSEQRLSSREHDLRTSSR